MGREIRRVPVDFDWPLNETWRGFLMPDTLQLPTCDDCDGHGTTTALRWVLASAHMLLMLDDDLNAQRRGERMHPYFRDYYTTAYGTRPSPDIREFGTGLAGREGGFLGHDACDGWAAARKLIEAAGLDPDTWGRCTTCGGDGSNATPAQREQHDAWTPEDPPVGDGWQLWETVSEGSPISPVFPSDEGLIAWLCSPAYTWGVSTPMQREQAEGFVKAGWAPSLVSSAATGLIPGEQYVGAQHLTS